MPNHCAYCKNPLTPRAAWKASDTLFYCNEFCADAADGTTKFIAGEQLNMEERPQAA